MTAGTRVLDLGYGPGAYAQRLARYGITGAGIDASNRFLDHGRQEARRERLPATFKQSSYLDCDLEADHDVALLAYEDYWLSVRVSEAFD